MLPPGLAGEFSEDCVRLRRFVPDISWAERTFDADQTLEKAGFSRSNSLSVQPLCLSVCLKTLCVAVCWRPRNLTKNGPCSKPSALLLSCARLS